MAPTAIDDRQSRVHLRAFDTPGRGANISAWTFTKSPQEAVVYRSRFAFELAMAALAAILLPSVLTAQITFERTYGGSRCEWASSGQQTADKGYVLAGATTSFRDDSSDFYIIRTDSIGEPRWVWVGGSTGMDEAYSVRQTTDGGYIVTGYECYYVPTSADVYLIRFGADGRWLWTTSYGGWAWDAGCSVQETGDSGYIIAGYTDSYGIGGDVYLVKTDAYGDTLWTRTYGGTHRDWGYSVQQTADNGYVVAGVTGSTDAGGAGVYLIRTDADGDSLWARTYGGIQDDRCSQVQICSDSGYIMVGSTKSFGSGLYDVYLVRTSITGDTLWTRAFGGPLDDQGFSVQQTTDGGYVIAGLTCSFGAGGSDVWLIKVDTHGDTMWTRTFGGSRDDQGMSVQQTTDGGFVVTGLTWSLGAGSDDVYLVKTDSLGMVVAVAEPKASPTRAPALSLFCEPNPSSGTTTIHLTPFAPRHSPLALRIFDAQGRIVRSFSSLLSPPSSLTWDGRGDSGQALPSGAYFVRVDDGNEHATTRVVLKR